MTGKPSSNRPSSVEPLGRLLRHRRSPRPSPAALIALVPSPATLRCHAAHCAVGMPHGGSLMAAPSWDLDANVPAPYVSAPPQSPPVVAGCSTTPLNPRHKSEWSRNIFPRRAFYCTARLSPRQHLLPHLQSAAASFRHNDSGPMLSKGRDTRLTGISRARSFFRP